MGWRLGAAAAVAVVAVAAWLNLEGLIQRMESTLGSAAGGRVPIWRETLNLIRDFPLVGTGAGTFAEAMFIYQRTSTQVLFNHAHDEYLQILAEGGVTLLVVVVAGLVLLVRTVHARLTEDHGASRFVRVGAGAALAAIGVQSIWETGLRSPANLLLAAILAAIAVRPLDRRESGEMPAA
jgi:O-antigen ligase